MSGEANPCYFDRSRTDQQAYLQERLDAAPLASAMGQRLCFRAGCAFRFGDLYKSAAAGYHSTTAAEKAAVDYTKRLAQDCTQRK